MTSTRLWRPAVLVKTGVGTWGAQSRGLIKPGLGHSYLTIFIEVTRFFFFKFTANKFLVFNWISFLQCVFINGSFAFSLC